MNTGFAQHAQRTATLIRHHQSDHIARMAGTGGAAGTMQERLRIVRRVDMHHQRHAANVNATCGHVGGDQHIHPAIGEQREIAVALPLAQIAMQIGCRNIVGAQTPGQLLGLELGPGKQNALALALGKGAYQRETPVPRGEKHMMGHQRHRRCRLIDTVDLGIVKESFDELIHAVIKRGGEQQALGAVGDLRQQPLNRGKETHIGHFVGFVEHGDLNGFQGQQVLPKQVLETPRTRHHDIRAGVQPGNLSTLLHAAVHGDRGQTHGAGERRQHLVDLVGEFTGRSENQPAGMRHATRRLAPACAFTLDPILFAFEFLHRGASSGTMAGETSNHRNRKRQRFARPGAATTQNVAPRQ